MEYRTFGKTGMKTSALAMGTWGIGGAGWDYNDDKTKLAAMWEAIEQGVNFFDTAPAYNGGAAEKLLGQAVKESGRRDTLVIATKCGNDFIDGKYVRDGSEKNILAQIDRSLKNLGVDVIDLYLLHWPDPDVTPEETYGALQKVRDSGKVKHLGVCNHTKDQIKTGAKYCDLEALQVQASMLATEWDDALSYAAENNFGTMAYGALGGGILTGRYRELKTYEEMDSRNRFYRYFKEPDFSRVMRLLDALEEVAKAHDHAPLSGIVLARELSRKDIATVLFGTQKAERVRENIAALFLTLSEKDRSAINEALAVLHGA